MATELDTYGQSFRYFKVALLYGLVRFCSILLIIGCHLRLLQQERPHGLDLRRWRRRSQRRNRPSRGRQSRRDRCEPFLRRQRIQYRWSSPRTRLCAQQAMARKPKLPYGDNGWSSKRRSGSRICSSWGSRGCGRGGRCCGSLSVLLRVCNLVGQS